MTFTSYNQFMSDLYRGGIELAAAHSADLGFSGVEFLDFCGTGQPLNKEKYPVDAVRATIERYGLEVDCYSVYANTLADNFESEIYEIIDYAIAIGAKLFHHTLMPAKKIGDVIPKYEDIFQKVLEIEKKIVKYCSERGLRCIFEPQGFYFNGVEGLSRIVLALREDFPDVGLCADLGNPVFVDCDPGDVVDALSFCIAHVHIKDYIISDESLEITSERRSRGGKYLYDALPGEGKIDLAACLKEIRKSGYDGRIALEYLGDDETIIKSMQYITKLWEE